MIYDLVIIGTGPAGLSAGLRAKELNLNYVILERKKICNLFLEGYPAGKCVTDFPKDLKIKGNFWFEECSVEELVEKWKKIAKKLNVKENEEVLSVKKNDERFFLSTNKKIYEAKNVVMAIGKEGKPRTLGVKGEELEKVFYKLKDPKEFQGKDILIVGGGNSAVDIALLLCEKNRVTISYRKDAFFRLNEKNVCFVDEKIKCYKIATIFKSNVKEIKKNKVILDVDGKEQELKNDFVFILAGSELPVDFFKKIDGIKIENEKIFLDENFQTSLKGLFVIGDAAGKPPFLIKPAINQGYEVVEFIFQSK